MPTPTAAATLKEFFDLAAETDEELRAAAALINASGPPWRAVNYRVMAAVQTADPVKVAAAIPAGLPHELLGAAILVYSDLVSRRAAMRGFAYARYWETSEELTAELRHGHTAAQRFDADLANVRALATSVPEVRPAPADSRAAAELLLLLEYVEIANTGCDSSGGQVITELPRIAWNTQRTGSVGGIAFRAEPEPPGWRVELIAC
jgi:hypothetical protein